VGRRHEADQPGGKRSRPAGDRAASPVIGVILVVAITIVLAAVVGGYVADLGNSLSEEAQAAATVDFSAGSGDGEVRITYVTRGNSEKIEVQFSLDPASGNSVSAPDGTVVDAPGESVRLTEDAGNTDEDLTVEVTVVAFEASGEKSVVLEREGTI